MRDFEDCGEIAVCLNCLLLAANGEYGERPEGLPEPLSAIPFGYEVFIGGAHRGDCPNGPDGTGDADCECEDLGFRQTSCDGCGDGHHGDRYQMTLNRATVDRARTQHTRMVTVASQFRQGMQGTIGHPIGYAPVNYAEYAHAHLALAAQWRMYIARIRKEERDLAQWLARHAAAA